MTNVKRRGGKKMGLFDLLGDIVKLPFSAAQDVGNALEGQKIDETKENVKDICDDVKDTLDDIFD